MYTPTPQNRKSSGRTINLGGKNTVSVCAGDRLWIYSPGGGGYGRATAGEEDIAAGPGLDDEEDIVVAATGSVHEWRMKHEQQ